LAGIVVHGKRIYAMNAHSLKILFVLGLALLAWAPVSFSFDYDGGRRKLLKVIEQDVRETEIYIGKSSFDPAVMLAMGKVARHAFVPEQYRYYSY